MQAPDQISKHRRTPQREVILQILQESNGPLSVKDIHARASKIISTIGIATVYRALKSLRDNGQIEAITLLSAGTLYQLEPNAHHDHFQCRQCRHIFDLDAVPIRIETGTQLEGGFLVEEHQNVLRGLCPDCVK